MTTTLPQEHNGNELDPSFALNPDSVPFYPSAINGEASTSDPIDWFSNDSMITTDDTLPSSYCPGIAVGGLNVVSSPMHSIQTTMDSMRVSLERFVKDMDLRIQGLEMSVKQCLWELTLNIHRENSHLRGENDNLRKDIDAIAAWLDEVSVFFHGHAENEKAQPEGQEAGTK